MQAPRGGAGPEHRPSNLFIPGDAAAPKRASVSPQKRDSAVEEPAVRHPCTGGAYEADDPGRRRLGAGDAVVLRWGGDQVAAADGKPTPSPGDHGVVLTPTVDGEVLVTFRKKGLFAISEADLVLQVDWSPVFAGGWELGAEVVMSAGDSHAHPGRPGRVHGGCDGALRETHVRVLWGGHSAAVVACAADLVAADQWSVYFAGGFCMGEEVVQAREGDRIAKPGTRGVVWGPVSSESIRVLWDGRSEARITNVSGLVRPAEFLASGLDCCPAKWVDVGSPPRHRALTPHSPTAGGELSPHHAKVIEVVADLGWPRGCRPPPQAPPKVHARLHWTGHYA
eukprot:TRINITY_DN16716_c1_g2_i1.p1 TRINITY_DN16716_c1_g2~~TRINITY_DN16716_c1_g2_i1.p1  ORF type:complete len:338 (+),score=72.87 TRINITY_DN16716_c1_g2_i1:81-1094(+)